MSETIHDISVQDFFAKVEEVSKLRTLLVISLGQPTDLLKNDRLWDHVKSGQADMSSITLRGKLAYDQEIVGRSMKRD